MRRFICLAAVAFIVGSTLTPVLARRIAPGRVMAAGLVLAAVGFALLARVDAAASVGQVVTAFVIYSLGLAPVFTLATDLVVGSAPPESAGVAAALSETGSELGGALGIAILGSIGSAVYRVSLSETSPPALAAEALEAASGTLGAAIASAQLMNPELGAALIDASRVAFVQGMRAGALIAVAVSVGTAALTAVQIGGARPPER